MKFTPHVFGQRRQVLKYGCWLGGPFVSAMTITVVISEVVHSCAIDFVPT